MPNLNICLHNVVKDDASIQTIYDVSLPQLERIFTTCEQIAKRLGLGDTSYYFDDGYESFKTYVAGRDWGISPYNLITAVITSLIDTPGRLTRDDLSTLHSEGYVIVPHGSSHAALAIFENGTLQATPEAGPYTESPYGKSKKLHANEVLFQLNESRNTLLSLFPDMTVDEFVLPYGLYNQSTAQLATQASYKRVLTCHTGLNNGQYLTPRHLITQENIDFLEADILHASESFELLF
jgi:hypothetical protein